MSDDDKDTVRESIRDVARKPVEKKETMREAKKREADEGNPYPHKLRD